VARAAAGSGPRAGDRIVGRRAGVAARAPPGTRTKGLDVERVAFLIEPTGERVDCLLNPEVVVFRREAGLRRRTLVGRAIGESAWSDDALVCTGGGLTELQLELLFDTSLVAAPRQVDNVRLLTAPFWALAEHATDSAGHRAPHLARFVWGKAWNLVGLVTAIAERFERFLPNGFPQRSWVRMNFVSVAEPSPSRAGISALDIPERSVAPSAMANLVGEQLDRSDADERSRLAAMGTDNRWDQLA